MINNNIYEFDEMYKMKLYDPDREIWVLAGNTGEVFTIKDFIEYFYEEIEAKSAEIKRKSAPQKALQKKHKKKIFNDKDIKKIKELKKRGISNRQIAKIFKCDEKTIRNYLKQTT